MPCDPILISNSFPFALVRRRVTAEPRQISDLRLAMRTFGWVSAWGHANTLEIVSAMVGIDLRPITERPALRLSPQLLPELDGQAFKECWLISPDYVPGYRPAIGQEVAAENIASWQVLQLRWEG